MHNRPHNRAGRDRINGRVLKHDYNRVMIQHKLFSCAPKQAHTNQWLCIEELTLVVSPTLL